MTSPAFHNVPTATVGDLVLTTRGGVTTVARRTTPREVVAAAVWPLAALLAVVCGSLAIHGRGVPLGRTTIGAVVVAAAGGFGSLGLLRLMALTSDRPRWQFISAESSVEGRDLGRVDDRHETAAEIVDVAVEPVRSPAWPVTRTVVVAVESSGVRHVLSVGRRRRVDRVAAAVRAALQIGPDPLGRSAYPPRPRWVRAARQVGPYGVTVTLHLAQTATRVGAFVVTGVAILVADHFAYAGRRFTFPPATIGQVGWDVAGSLVNAVILGGVVGIGRLTGWYRRLRWVRVTVDANTYGPVVVVHERRTRSSFPVSWPIAEVVSPRLAVHRGGRRADLSLLLGDGRLAPLIRDRPAREVRYVRDSLVVALGRGHQGC